MKLNRRGQRGSSLVEVMISLLILSFGILGLARFQMGMLAQATDAQQRLAASALSEVLLAQIRADLANVDCYTLPIPMPECASLTAPGQASAWDTQVHAQLQGTVTTKVERINTNQVAVTMSWTSKASPEPRQQQVITDVRP